MNAPHLEQSKPDSKQLLIQALEMRWVNYRTQLKNCRSEFTEEAVHDLRVATRRMLALIQLLNSIAPQPRLKKMASTFKGQLDAFDNLRDTQVILTELSEIIQELPQLDEFEAHLRSHEEQMLQDLRSVLKKWDTAGLSRWIRRTQDLLEAETGADLTPLILDSVDDAYLTVQQRLGWVDLTRSSTIHRVRVAFKAFRYMVEIVNPLLKDFPPGILKQMNEYQTLMGNIQDAEVFAQTLAGYTSSAPFPELEAVHHYYEQRRTEAISAFVDSMDQLHTFWRPASGRPFPW